MIFLINLKDEKKTYKYIFLKKLFLEILYSTILPNFPYKNKNCLNIFHPPENSIKLWPPTFLSSSYIRIRFPVQRTTSLSIRNELPDISVQRWLHHTEKHISSIFPTYLHYESDWNNRGDKIEGTEHSNISTTIRDTNFQPDGQV